MITVYIDSHEDGPALFEMFATLDDAKAAINAHEAEQAEMFVWYARDAEQQWYVPSEGRENWNWVKADPELFAHFVFLED